MHGTAHVPPVRVGESRTLDLGFLEPLEHRVLLAISVAVSGNTVSFTGDEAANNLILTVQTGNLAYSVDGGATYSQNLSPGHSGATTRKIGSLSSIVVNLGAGTDTLGIEPALTALWPGSTFRSPTRPRPVGNSSRSQGRLTRRTTGSSPEPTPARSTDRSASAGSAGSKVGAARTP